MSCSRYRTDYRGKQILYKYEIEVLDKDGNPVEDANIDYDIREGRKTIAHKVIRTQNDGIFKDEVKAYKKLGVYLWYSITKMGYCDEVGKITSLGKSSGGDTNLVSEQIYLNKATFAYSQFNLKVFGLNKKPVQDVWIDYDLLYKGKNIISDNGLTGENGVYIDSIKYNLCQKMGSSHKLKLNISKDGYYPTDTTAQFRRGGFGNLQMTMISRTDYIHPLLLKNEFTKGLVSNVLAFIDLVILRSLLSDCILEYYSVNVKDFKNKAYITFKFDNKVVYNSLRLNKYDIAERLFDEVVRKILNPLNKNLGDSKLIYGYSLNIKAATKSFTDEDAISETLIYDFYLPQDEVKSYKNLDITGQQLLDKSIILQNGERIGLKLQ